MKNGIISHSVFKAIDEAREILGIKDVQWAKAAGFTDQTRITELRNRYEGRALSYEKVVKLVEGLKKLRGDAIVTRELIKLIKKVDSGRDKLVLMTLAIPDSKIKQCELYLEALLESEQKGKE